MYLYLKNIDNNEVIKYIFIAILISIVVTRIAPSPLTILSIVCGVFVVYIINEKAVSESTIYGKIIEKMLQSPILESSKNENLQLDPEIVSFLDLHKEYFTYNHKLYNRLVKLLDNFLNLKTDIIKGSVNFHADYDTLLSLKPKILNTYHDFIYNVPHAEASLDKFHTGMKSILNILNGHLIKVNTLILDRSKMEKITTETKFHYRMHPKPANQGTSDTYHH